MEEKKSYLWENIRAVILLIVVAFGAYYYHENYQYGPCEKPISYSLGEFDAGFGVSKESFLSAVAEAEAMWEREAGKELFSVTDDKGLVINLKYDDRQKLTERDALLRAEIDKDTNVAESVKDEFLTLKAKYAQAVSSYDAAVREYGARQSAYNARVDAANRRGGAKEKEYAALSEERSRLETEAVLLEEKRLLVNSLAEQVNALIKKYNLIAEDINEKAGVINQFAGEKFSAGEYIRDEEGERINIYQFDDREKMVRVIAHEFGHALGVDHVPDTASVMYEMNSGRGENLGEGDISAMNELCFPKK